MTTSRPLDVRLRSARTSIACVTGKKQLREVAAIRTLICLSLLCTVGCDTSTPPNAPEEPFGPENSVVGYCTPFSTRTIDHLGEQLSYRFDWGDGHTSNWSSLLEPDSSVEDTHTWNKAGTFEVRAQARNKKHAESDWSAPNHFVVLDC